MFVTEVRRFREVLAGFDVARLDPADAARVVAELAALERAAAALKAVAATRVPAVVVRAAGVRDAGEWLARTAGTTAAAARGELLAAERLASLGDTAGAARRGELSVAQVAAVVDAATADPSAEARLLEAARRQSLGELRDEAARVKAAADRDPAATRARLHAARRWRRFGTPDGLEHIQACGPPEAMARVDAALRPLIEERFAKARRDGAREPHEAYAFDAFLALVDRPPADQKRRRSKYRAVLRADLTALVRGHVEGDETCEIDGAGPVSVDAARELLGDAVLNLVLTLGNDVANVTYLGRGPNAAQKIALLWQAPRCARLGCPRRARIQYDHRTPFAHRRETRLDNLDGLCGPCHRLKTTQRWALITGTGRRPMVAPDHPHHPANTDRPASTEGAGRGPPVRASGT